jgi:hypothetical protein
MPECFTQTPDGLLFISNGIDPVLRWDGLTSFMEEAGVRPPTGTPSLTGSGVGSIVGDYYAYLRYVDRLGNVSNLSPISAVYAASGSTGSVSGATNATPIVITTSAAHGLINGATVKIEGVGGNTSANNTWTITVLSSTTFSLDDSSGTASYTGGGTWTSGVGTITYSSLQAPSDPKITRRQVLRNTDGQTDTFYVDLDTEDLSSSSLSSTKDDSTLSAQTAVPLLDSDGNTLANRYGLPPNDKSVMTYFSGRMWAAVEREYKTGNVQVTNGSPTVYGIGTRWVSELEGRFFWVKGAGEYYEIDAVDEAAHTLTLTESFTGDTDLFAIYSIRPAYANRRLIPYSEAGLPEAWLATNSIEVPEDGDTLTGLMPKGPRLYVLEEKNTWAITLGDDFRTDGGIFHAYDRGCVNNNCWLLVDSSAFMLDEEGIHRFGGDEGIAPVSDEIADLFATTTGRSGHRINWEAREQFHACHFLPEATMRWFVCLDGHWIPHHAICYQYRDRRWWIESFRVPIGASAIGNLRRNYPQQFLGTIGDILAYGRGNLDGPGADQGTVRGTVTGSGIDSITDSGATFASTGIVGNPVSIVYGTGKGQTRNVSAVSGTTVKVNFPWLIRPDTTSVYQLGAVEWRWQSGWFRLYPSEKNTVRRIECVFQPLGNDATFDIRIYTDFSEAAYNWGVQKSSDDGGGIESNENDPDLVCDFTKYNGLVQARMDGSKDLFMDGKRFFQIGLFGFTNDEQQSIYEVSIDGALPKSGQ